MKSATFFGILTFGSDVNPLLYNFLFVENRNFMCIQFTDLVFIVSCFQEGRGNVALYHTICTCTLRAYIYICYMAYRTLDPRYTLLTVYPDPCPVPHETTNTVYH